MENNKDKINNQNNKNKQSNNHQSDNKNQPIKNKQEPVKNDNLNNKINELLAENTSLKNDLANKEKKIHELELRIKEFNENYKNEITKKAVEAQKLVELKVKEQQEKFDKEVQHIKKFALKDKAIELINIINNFDVAVGFTPDDPKLANYVQGFRMFSTMFKNYLSSNNIIAIEPAVGDIYDPITMEALETENNPNFKPNQLTKIVKKGYKLHDIVLIPANVIVCKDRKDKN